MDKIKLKALGKINLGLDVLGRRPNLSLIHISEPTRH